MTVTERAVFCQSKVDVGFILDSSGSLGLSNYKIEKQLLKQLAAGFGQESRVAVITFSSYAQLR